MTKQKITIEKSKAIFKSVYSSLVIAVKKNGPDKLATFNEIKNILADRDIKIGFGGSHIWAANMNNERLFIITGY